MSEEWAWGEPEEDLQRVLTRRAQALARVMDEGGERTALGAILFRLQTELCALELPLLRGVRPAQGLTLVPCAPTHIAGVLNVRGEIITVLELGTILGRPSPSAPDVQQVLLVDSPEGRVGLLVDEVVGVRDVVKDEIDRSFVGHGYAFGVAEASFTFLNLTQLLGDRQLVVDDDVA